MNVSTMAIQRDEALLKLDKYKSLAGKRRVSEDDHLQSLYRAVRHGGRVIDLAAAFQETGLNESRQPRLAIARADWKNVECSLYSMRGQNWGLRFGVDDHWRGRASDVRIPLNKPRSELFAESWLSSPVPHIPPDVRPKFRLNNYHILFEVKKWTVYPVDPFLLRRISGMLFIVEAEWELTELEASILSGMQAGN